MCLSCNELTTPASHPVDSGIVSSPPLSRSGISGSGNGCMDNDSVSLCCTCMISAPESPGSSQSSENPINGH